MADTRIKIYEIITGNAATIVSTLMGYERTHRAHTVEIHGFDYDGTNYHVLVSYIG